MTAAPTAASAISTAFWMVAKGASIEPSPVRSLPFFATKYSKAGRKFVAVLLMVIVEPTVVIPMSVPAAIVKAPFSLFTVRTPSLATTGTAGTVLSTVIPAPAPTPVRVPAVGVVQVGGADAPADVIT